MINNVSTRPRKLFLFISLIIILTSASGCGSYFDDAKEVERNFDDRYYTFDPNTILDALHQGKADVFTLLEATPEPMPPTLIPPVTVQWTQADYLRVVQAVQQSIWQEPLGTLDMYYATFRMDCRDINKGVFSEVDFVLYNVLQTGEGETRVQYHNMVTPSENYINTTRAEYYPNMNFNKPIDLTQYPITAEKALQIAEENGGAQKRSEVDNSCMIFGMVQESDGWTVSYDTRNEYRWKTVYKIAINPLTGSFKVTRPKK